MQTVNKKGETRMDMSPRVCLPLVRSPYVLNIFNLL